MLSCSTLAAASPAKSAQGVISPKYYYGATGATRDLQSKSKGKRKSLALARAPTTLQLAVYGVIYKYVFI